MQYIEFRRGGVVLKKNMTFLDKVTVLVEEKIAPPLIKLSKFKYLEAMQKAAITVMPYTIIGATATLINNLDGLFGEGGLNMPGAAAKLASGLEVIRPVLMQMIFTSLNILGMLTVLVAGYALGEIYARKDDRIRPIVAGVLALVSFLTFIDFPTLSENFDWPNYVLGAPSLLGGIIIGFFAVEGYRFFVEKNITIKMPDSVPPMVADSFTSLIPVSAVILVGAILGAGFGDKNLLHYLNAFAEKLVIGGSGFFVQFFAFFLDRLLWFVGLHGSNIVGNVMGIVWTQMNQANIAAYQAGTVIPYVYTSSWITFYVRLSVFPIALMLVRSNVERFRVLGKLSLPGTIFNIAEPIMYGLPIVLNPLMFVPWVIGFSAMFVFNAILAAIGVLPPAVAAVVWTMPVPLAAYIGTGYKLIAPLISILNMVILYFIFLPFFRVMEKEELKKEQELKNQTVLEA